MIYSFAVFAWCLFCCGYVVAHLYVTPAGQREWADVGSAVAVFALTAAIFALI